VAAISVSCNIDKLTSAGKFIEKNMNFFYRQEEAIGSHFATRKNVNSVGKRNG
jgi:hypothetical protein